MKDDIDWGKFRYECGQIFALGIGCLFVVFATIMVVGFFAFMGKVFTSITLGAIIIMIISGIILRYGFGMGDNR